MEEEEVLRIDDLVIEPNACELQAPLHLQMTCTLLRPVPRAYWCLCYEADYTNKRVVIPLYTSVPTDFVPGKLTFVHDVPEIKTEGVKEKYLLQVGLLKLSLHSDCPQGQENVATINMVTMVTKEEAGKLIRNVISPLL